jgi:hypothetical protein
VIGTPAVVGLRRGSNQRIDRKFKPLVLGQNQTGVDSATLSVTEPVWSPPRCSHIRCTFPGRCWSDLSSPTVGRS